MCDKGEEDEDWRGEEFKVNEKAQTTRGMIIHAMIVTHHPTLARIIPIRYYVVPSIP